MSLQNSSSPIDKAHAHDRSQSMVKPYQVVDDALSDDLLSQIHALSHTISYYSNEDFVPEGLSIKHGQKPDGHWRGFRSDKLHLVNKWLFNQICNELITKTFGTSSFNYEAIAYIHKMPESIIEEETWWHKDGDCAIFAGVLYLSLDPAAKSGTLIQVDSNVVTIDNKYNRFVMYGSTQLHKPHSTFGQTSNNCRTTLTLFVVDLLLSYRAGEHKPHQ